jgi:hypothetical protein
MKKIMVFCDRCGQEIKGYPLKLTADYVSRIDDSIPVTSPMPEKLKKALMDDCSRDYCEDCMIEIFEFAHMNMDAKTFASEKQELEEEQNIMTDSELKKKIKVGQREMIEQLYARGVSVESIAKDMGMEQIIVRSVIEQMKKAG